MQARRLVCKAMRQVGWETSEMPGRPEPHQVLVKSACSLISAGTEIAIYSGSHVAYALPAPPPWFKFPIAMGYAMAGTVQAVGSEVEAWAEGDRVMVHAPHGDYALCDARAATIHRLPAAVSMQQGALARMGGISLVGIRQGQVALGEAAVVFGLGLIGQFAAQLCRLAGARPVIGVDVIAGRGRVAAAGGVVAVNPREADPASVVREMTGGRMAEVVIEATGNPDVVPMALDVAAEGGRVILLGSLRGNIEIDAYSTIHRKGIALVGAHDRLSEHAYTPQDPWTCQRNLDLVLTLFADGSLKDEGLISHRIQPDSIQEMYEMLVARPRDILGALIEWDTGLYE